MGEDRDYHNQLCVNALPLALLLMPLALLRYARDEWSAGSRPAGGEWNDWLACRVCRRPSGRPCIARSGRVVDGRPDDVIVELKTPHGGRRRRAGR